MTDIQKLKSAAESIQSEGWGVSVADVCRVHEVDGTTYVQCWSRVAECTDVDIAKFIAAANPAAVLGLIAEIDSLRGYGEEFASLAERRRENCDQLKAENERLQQFEIAYKEYSDKTEWLQETAHWSELGMHRADVLRKRCDDAASHVQAQADQIVKLMAENEELVTALNDILRVTPMGVEAFGIAALVLGELGVSKEADNG